MENGKNVEIHGLKAHSNSASEGGGAFVCFYFYFKLILYVLISNLFLYRLVVQRIWYLIIFKLAPIMLLNKEGG